MGLMLAPNAAAMAAAAQMRRSPLQASPPADDDDGGKLSPALEHKRSVQEDAANEPAWAADPSGYLRELEERKRRERRLRRALSPAHRRMLKAAEDAADGLDRLQYGDELDTDLVQPDHRLVGYSPAREVFAGFWLRVCAWRDSLRWLLIDGKPPAPEALHTLELLDRKAVR